MTYKELEKCLGAYRCTYTRDSDGEGFSLVDILSPGPTVEEGELELEILTEHIALFFAEITGQEITDD